MPRFNKHRKNRNRAVSHKMLRTIIITAGVSLLLLSLYLLIIKNYNNDRNLNAEHDQLPPLVLVWEYAGIEHDIDAIGEMPGLAVVSPTWFKITDHHGSINDITDQDYIDWARSRGYQIWALVTNSFNPELTAMLLSDPEIRNNTAAELVKLALKYELDGLNIDFENFHSDYRDHFTLFVSELSKLCSDNNLILSVDITMISSSDYWSLGYDRAALAVEADYVILMAYDEHWQSSPVAGSVSSLPWVERGLQRILEEVPAHKLILGVPFYTRLWEIDNYCNEPIVLNSWSYSMQRAEEIIADYEAEVYWDSEARQFVARYMKDNLTYKMWLEEITSMRGRLELVEKY
ncbi:MAG: glycosyl hydrolase family 18 protein, partial [Dethiobacteria bacterium]|nr:glycosyl hydrolase family 18 protein [Dethiobacteria bacterium]